MLILIAGVTLGWMANGWRLNEKIAGIELDIANQISTNTAAALTIQIRNQQIADLIDTKTLAEEAAHRAKTAIVTREVIKYVQNPSTGSCDLNDWVQPHNRAASMPSISKPARSPIDTP